MSGDHIQAFQPPYTQAEVSLSSLYGAGSRGSERVSELPRSHSKEKAEQRLLWNLARLFLLAGMGGSGPNRAS